MREAFSWTAWIGEKEISRLRQSVNGEGMLTREAIKGLSTSVYLYGIYAIPMYIDGIKEYNDPVSFFSLCRTLHLAPYMEGVERSNKAFSEHRRGTDSGEEAFMYIQESYSTEASKVTFVSEWWAEKKHTFTRIEELYAAIDTAVKEAEASVDPQDGAGAAVVVDAKVVEPGTEPESDTSMSAPSDADTANKPVQAEPPIETSSTKDKKGLKIAIALVVVLLVAALALRMRRKPERPAS